MSAGAGMSPCSGTFPGSKRPRLQEKEDTESVSGLHSVVWRTESSLTWGALNLGGPQQHGELVETLKENDNTQQQTKPQRVTNSLVLKFSGTEVYVIHLPRLVGTAGCRAPHERMKEESG